MIWVCFNYPFVQLGCSKLFGQVPASNRKALEFDLKLGFIEEARVKDVFPDGDLIVIAMKREDCRWLKLKPRSLKEHV
jgi:RimJ/RimL family protein N-acetyltransferase